MTAFVLIPGAGGMASYWHRVSPLLQREGHEAIAVELPGDDESMDLDDYADIVVRAIGERSDVILVAQSLGGFTAPLVCARVASIRMLVFVNAMIPRPDETAGAWWANTGAVEARAAAARAGGYGAAFDLMTYFLHDVPETVLRDGPSGQRQQAETIFGQRCAFGRWPSIPIRVVASAGRPLFSVRVPEARGARSPEHGPGNASWRPSDRALKPERSRGSPAAVRARGVGSRVTAPGACDPDFAIEASWIIAEKMMLDIEICIDVPDLARGVQFYANALGFSVVSEPYPGVAVLMVGASKITLLEKREGTRPSPGAQDVRRYGRHWTPVHLDFHVDDLKAALDKAVNAGAIKEQFFEDPDHGSAAFCADPFGNGFCLLERRAK